MSEGTIAQVLSGEATWSVAHGDCLEVLRALPDKSVVVVTDFPYCLGKAIANDSLPWEEYLPWLDERLVECVRAGKRVFSTFATTKLIRFVRETTVPPTYPLHWHKPMMFHDRNLNGSPFIAHGEQILYWGPSSAKEGGKRGYDSFAVSAMWPSDREAVGTDHPTPKPLELYLRALEFWTDADDIVIDPFMGSGTTLIAALRLGRRVIGVDIDERWVNETRARIEAEMKGVSLGDLKRGQGALFDIQSAPKKGKRRPSKKRAAKEVVR